MSLASPSSTEFGRFDNLDGVRSVACLLVLSSHLFFEIILRHFPSSAVASNPFAAFLFGNGGLGVQIFFGLSGFLITSLLLAEHRRTGTINLVRFYARRVLRIWPVYFLVVFFVFVVYATAKTALGHTGEIHEDWVMSALFLSNFDLIRILEDGTRYANGMLALTWSVSVEEQFYLAWPLLMLAVGMKNLPRALLPIMGCAVLFSLVTPSHVRVYHHSISNALFLASGALLAHMRMQNAPIYQWARKLGSVHWLCTGLVMAAGLALLKQPLLSMRGGLAVYMVWAALAVFILLLHQVLHEHAGLGRVRWLVWLAKYTYGLYMYHRIAGFICSSVVLNFLDVRETPLVGFLLAMLTLGCALGLSILSFRFMEAPLLSVKRRFEPGFAR